MPINYGRSQGIEGKLSYQLLKWVGERVPVGDPIRISNFECYAQIDDLGKGRFGQVCKYINNNTKLYETVKKVNMDMFDHWTQDALKLSNRLDSFILEFRHLHKISNDNERIVNFIGMYSDSQKMYIMSEYLPKGSIKDLVMRENIEESVAMRYLLEATDALQYLHSLSPPVIHRDIKAANLLLSSHDHVKLGNFGLVRDLAIDGFGTVVSSEITFDFRGTLLYVAPEVLNSKLGPGNRTAYQTPADIWALGCTFVEMLLKTPPHFEYFGHVSEIPKVLLGYAREDDGKELPYTAEVLVPSSSTAIQRIVDAIFVKDPESRLSAKNLKKLVNRVITNLEIDSENEYYDDRLSSDSNSSTEDVSASSSSHFPRKIGAACTSLPIETLENGVTKRESPMKTKRMRRRQTDKSHFFLAFGYFGSRIIYFLGILSKSVCYLLMFLTFGIGCLTLFLFLSFGLVHSSRLLIEVYCDCELVGDQYSIIGGILIVLLFALLFSCCMVALGEYKFRMANRTLRESRFFISRPEKSAKLLGFTVFPGKEANRSIENPPDEENTAREQSIMKNHDDYYYDTP